MLFRFSSIPFAVALLLPLLNGCPERPPVVQTEVEEVDAPAASTAPAKLSELTFGEADWPQWRGPQGDGHASDPAAPREWDASTNVAWRADVPGRGHASPTIYQDQVFLATARDEAEEQLILAYDRASGSENWRTVVHQGEFPDPRSIHRKGTNANGTIACDGERLFAAFLNGGKIWLTATDLAGTVLWQQAVGAFSPKFGYAPSPVLYKSLVIVSGDNQGGGYLAALDRQTGELIWRKKRPAISSYSSPLVATIDGRDQLVISGCHTVTSYAPLTGERLWSCEAIAEATCGTPVTDGTHVFASGGYPDRETACILGDGSGKKVWSDKAKIYEPSMLYVEGFLYAVTDDGIALCWAATSGELQWRERLGGDFSASPTLCNGLLYVPNLAGETLVFEANPEAYTEVARNRLGDDAYASPAIAGGQIFLRVGFGEGRDRKESLICIAAAQ